MTKPAKPTPDFPLFPHASGSWAKKIDGRIRYFGSWSDPDGALTKYTAFLNGDDLPPKPTRLARAKKPAKPYRDFPLYAHRSGLWAKTIRGKDHYFGPWNDPDAALNKYLAEKDALLAGRTPTPAETGTQVNIKYVIDRFLSTKEAAWHTGEIAERTFHDYEDVCKRLVQHLDRNRLVADLTPTDFEELRTKLTVNRGPTSLGNDITRIRVLFKYAFDQELIAKPVRYGQGFKKPKKVVLRRAKRVKGLMMFKPNQIQLLINAADYKLRAMILLGINCGFGNNDCAKLPISALDLNNGWHTYHRPKTEIERRCPLWPETVRALRAVLAKRKRPADPELSDRVFVTLQGGSFEGSAKDQPISKRFRKLLKSLGIHSKGIGFYALRHTFQTVGEVKGEIPTKYIMGHCPPSEDMSAVYREQITDERLKRVAKYVRNWVFKQTPLRVAAEDAA